MTGYYLVINHASQTQTVLMSKEDGDEITPHRRQQTSEQHIQGLREKASIEVRELEIGEKQ